MSFLSYMPKILLAIVIPILDSLYNNIALWLNDMGKSTILLSARESQISFSKQWAFFRKL